MSALPDNMLTATEQRANAHRGLIYTLALSFAVVAGLIAAAVVLSLFWRAQGYIEGELSGIAKGRALATAAYKERGLTQWKCDAVEFREYRRTCLGRVTQELRLK
jgi:hypothetical protein